MADWVGISIAGAALVISAVSLVLSMRSIRAAERSAGASERSATAAETSADAAGRAADIAQKGLDARREDLRRQSSAHLVIDLGSFMSGEQRLRVRNLGPSAAVDFRVVRTRINGATQPHRGRSEGVTIAPGEELKQRVSLDGGHNELRGRYNEFAIEAAWGDGNGEHVAWLSTNLGG